MYPTIQAITTAPRISYVEAPVEVALLFPVVLGLALEPDAELLVVPTDVEADGEFAGVEDESAGTDVAESTDEVEDDDKPGGGATVEPLAAAAAYASMVPAPVAGVLTPRTIPFLH